MVWNDRSIMGGLSTVLVVAGRLTTVSCGQVTLTDQTASSNIKATYVPAANGIPDMQERMTGGMAVGDFNNDGHQDLYWVSGGTIPDKLFINNGDGTFTDMAAAWQLTALHCGNGASVADFNGDGWLDIYVTSFGPPDVPGGIPGQHRLYRNNGNNTFTNVAESAGVQFSSPLVPGGYGSAWGDYDLDGDLDLFVASWMYAADGNRLYRNNGDETFTDVTVLALGSSIDGVRGFQPAFVDMDGDLYPEILLSADYATSRYYVNNRNGTFTDYTERSGTGMDDYGMGQTVGDFNNDGLLDWYVTSIFLDVPLNGNNPGSMLYLNLGNHRYLETSAIAGTVDGGWGWGTVALDLDHDGWQDILEVNGWCPSKKSQFCDERGKLFYNDGESGTFSEIAFEARFDTTERGRPIVYLDVDRDGDLDVVVGNRDAATEFYRNDTPAIGNWLRISFDTSTNPLIAPNGFGTRVTATVGKKLYCRYMSASPSYLATSELTVHFGLGTAPVVDDLLIQWTRGNVTRITNVPVNQHLTISAPVLGDLDGDGSIGILDFLDLLAWWGPVDGPQGLRADLDNNGSVDINDLEQLLASWTGGATRSQPFNELSGVRR